MGSRWDRWNDWDQEQEELSSLERRAREARLDVTFYNGSLAEMRRAERAALNYELEGEAG